VHRTAGETGAEQRIAVCSGVVVPRGDPLGVGGREGSGARPSAVRELIDAGDHRVAV